MAILQSNLFVNADEKARNDAAVDTAVKESPEFQTMNVKQRLEDCASIDPKHITRPQQGPHVTVIHRALDTLALATPLPVKPSGTPGAGTGEDGEAQKFNAGIKALKANRVLGPERKQAKYLQETQRAVLAYKKARDIRRPGASVNDIVGILTIQALDRDLITASGGTPTPPTPPPNPDGEIVDIIVRFIGASSESEIEPEGAVFPDFLMTEYRKKPNRKPVRIGKFTASTGAGSSALLADFVNRVKQNLKGKRKGKLIIFGSSSGGRNALDLALRLSNEFISMDYVALQDAAFFDEGPPEGPVDKPDRPPPFSPTNAPRMSRRLVLTAPGGKLENFFQTKGNRSKFNSNILGWTSNMFREEIHGEVTGFTPRDLSLQMSPNEKDGAVLHGSAVFLSEPLVLGTIKDILDKA